VAARLAAASPRVTTDGGLHSQGQQGFLFCNHEVEGEGEAAAAFGRENARFRQTHVTQASAVRPLKKWRGGREGGRRLKGSTRRHHLVGCKMDGRPPPPPRHEFIFMPVADIFFLGVMACLNPAALSKRKQKRKMPAAEG
jgi:hypothetical protein